MINIHCTVDNLDVPFEKKDKVKRVLLWDSDAKSWKTRRFSVFGVKWDKTLNKWIHESEDGIPIKLINKYRRIYLDVPFDDKDFVKKNGGRWDAKKKKWHTIASNDELLCYMPDDYLYESLKSTFHFDEKDISEWK
jgi:hypothetical protein